MRNANPMPGSIVCRLLMALSLSVSLAACSTNGGSSMQSTENTSVEAVPQLAMGCLENQARWTIGRTADTELAEKAKNDAEARFVRIVRPGHAYTMEYNGARLNLNTDKNGLILSVNCG